MGNIRKSLLNESNPKVFCVPLTKAPLNLCYKKEPISRNFLPKCIKSSGNSTLQAGGTDIWHIIMCFRKTTTIPFAGRESTRHWSQKSLVSGSKLPLLSVCFQRTALPGAPAAHHREIPAHKLGICQLFISVSKRAALIPAYQGLK